MLKPEQWDEALFLPTGAMRWMRHNGRKMDIAGKVLCPGAGSLILVGAVLDLSALRHVGVQRFDLPYPTGRARGFNFFFETTAWRGELAPGEATSELGWFAPDALPPDILPWLPAAIHTHLVERRFWVESIG